MNAQFNRYDTLCKSNELMGIAYKTLNPSVAGHREVRAFLRGCHNWGVHSFPLNRGLCSTGVKQAPLLAPLATCKPEVYPGTMCGEKSATRQTRGEGSDIRLSRKNAGKSMVSVGVPSNTPRVICASLTGSEKSTRRCFAEGYPPSVLVCKTLFQKSEFSPETSDSSGIGLRQTVVM